MTWHCYGYGLVRFRHERDLVGVRMTTSLWFLLFVCSQFNQFAVLSFTSESCLICSSCSKCSCHGYLQSHILCLYAPIQKADLIVEVYSLIIRLSGHFIWIAEKTTTESILPLCGLNHAGLPTHKRTKHFIIIYHFQISFRWLLFAQMNKMSPF